MPWGPSLGLRVRQWKVDFGTCRNIIMASRDSAPGPDGIPYSAWKIAPLHVLEALHLCYSSWIDYGALPHGFGHSYLWLLPKGDDPNDNDGIMLRSPEQTRPLSGANTDSRLFATCLRHSIEDAVCEWAHPFQKGFLRGRNILENVLDIEKSALLASCAPNNTSATILLDFRAAFPSLSRTFIRSALRHANFPLCIVRAAHQLYKDNLHYLKFGGRIQEAFITHTLAFDKAARSAQL